MNEPLQVVLVDGTCIFCNRLVAMLLRFDRRGRYHFAHLQSDYARSLIERSGVEPDVDAIYLVEDAGTDAQRLLVDSAAGKVIWPSIFWVLWPMKLVPGPLLDLFYRGFARVRYRLFGQAEACIVVEEAQRARFLTG